MADWFVSPDHGSDANDGTSWAQCFATVDELHNHGFADNDRVFLASGEDHVSWAGFNVYIYFVALDYGDAVPGTLLTYVPSARARVYGLADATSLINQTGDYEAYYYWIDFDGSGHTFEYLLYARDNTGILGLYYCRFRGGQIGVRKQGNGARIIAIGCLFEELTSRGIYSNQGYVEVEDCEFKHGTYIPVHLANGSNGDASFIKRSKFWGINSDCIRVDGKGATDTVLVQQCSFDDCDGGVNNTATNNAAMVTTVNSCIFSRTVDPINLSGGVLNYDYCCFYSNTNSPEGTEVDAGHTVAADPRFWDAATGNLNIRDSSPCKNTGDPLLTADANGHKNIGMGLVVGPPEDDPTDSILYDGDTFLALIWGQHFDSDPSPTTTRFLLGGTAPGAGVAWTPDNDEVQLRGAGYDSATATLTKAIMQGTNGRLLGLMWTLTDLVLLDEDGSELCRIEGASSNFPELMLGALNSSFEQAWYGRCGAHLPFRTGLTETQMVALMKDVGASRVPPIHTSDRNGIVVMEARGVKSDGFDGAVKATATINGKAASEVSAAAVVVETKESTWDAKQNAVTINGTSPSSPSVNDLWLDVTDSLNIWKRWTGGAWEVATPTTLAEIASNSDIRDAINAIGGVNEASVDGLTGRLGVLPLAIADRDAVVVTRPDGIAENGVEPTSAVIAQLVNGGSGGRHGIGIYRSYTNVIPNPHFGSGDTTGWNNTGGANRVGVIADSDAVSGYVAEVGDGVADTDIEYITYYENVTPGETVAISCRLRLVSGTIFNVNYDRASVTFYDASNNPVSGGGVLAQFASAPSVMKEYSGVFTASATAAKVRIIFYVRAESDAIVHVEWGQITHTGFVLPFAVGTTSPGTLRYSIDDLLAVRSGAAWMQPFVYAYQAGEDILRYLLVGDDPNTLSLRVAVGGNLIFRLDSTDEISYSLGYAAEETKIQLAWDGVDTFYLIVGGEVRGSATAASMPTLTSSWILGSDEATPPANQADGGFTQQTVPLPMSNGLSEASILALALQFSATTVPLSWTGRGPQEIADRQIAAIDEAKLVALGFGYLLKDTASGFVRLDASDPNNNLAALNTAAGT